MRFGSLQTRLTCLFGGLFALALVLVAAVVDPAIAENARAAVRNELVASGTVFDRLWALRSDRMRSAAELLARDYGFRAAAATRDEATIASALDNLKARLGTDQAFLVTQDGTIVGTHAAAVTGRAAALWAVLDANGRAAGVIRLGGLPYQAVAAPVMAPDLQGWVVFAARLDAREMHALERLAAIPLEAHVVDGMGDAHAEPGLVRIAAAAIRTASVQPVSLSVGGEDAVVLATPLAGFDGARTSALVLSYPMRAALEPYLKLRGLMLLAGLGALASVLTASALLARNLVRPIKALDCAVRALERGQDVHLSTTAIDEVGRLTTSFKQMAGEIRTRERQMLELASTDAATGLPNRLALEHAAGVLSPNGGLVVVAAFGIARYAEIRGALGFELADRMVASVGAHLAHASGLVAARLSTSSIGIAFGARDAAEAERVAARVLDAAQVPVDVAGQTVDIALTCGFECEQAETLLSPRLVDRAVVALDQARRAKRALQQFDAASYGDPVSALSLMGELLSGIAAGDLALQYQPKLDLRQGKVSSVEALVRWRHPVRGMLRPDLFIGLAEETGHIRELTDWVIDRAIADRAILAADGHQLRVSVNISGRSLADPGFAAAAIARVGSAAPHILFELTETHAMDDPQAALAMMRALVSAGIGISIDDYGAGYSSLAYLKTLPATELKIDRAFIATLDTDARDALLVKSTIDLAHGLGMKVVAEGIETETVLAVLRNLGCDLAQGYYVARPMAVADLQAWLATQQAADRAVPAARTRQPVRA